MTDLSAYRANATEIKFLATIVAAIVGLFLFVSFDCRPTAVGGEAWAVDPGCVTLPTINIFAAVGFITFPVCVVLAFELWDDVEVPDLLAVAIWATVGTIVSVAAVIASAGLFGGTVAAVAFIVGCVAALISGSMWGEVLLSVYSRWLS